MTIASLIKRTPADPIIDKFLSLCRKRNYAAKKVIINEGEESDTLYYIVRGSVSVQSENDNGNEVIFAYINEGEFFGEIGFFENDQRTALIVARAECEIAEISYEDCRNFIKEEPELLMRLSKQMAHRLRRTSQTVRNLIFLDVTGRIASILRELAKEPDAMTHPDGMQIRITRQDIAKMVGCSREMAGRVLKELESDGLINAHGKTIVVYGTR